MRALPLSFQLALKYNRDLRLIAAAACFYGSACLGHFLRFDGSTDLPAWPPSGVGFAIILLLGRHTWPGIAIGSLLASFLSPWMSADLPVQSLIAVTGLVAISHSVEALLGATLLRWWVKDAFPFNTSRGAFRFLFVAVAMCLCGALISVTALHLNGVIPRSEWLARLVSWMVGSLVGVLLFTPFFLCVARRQKMRFSREKALEIVAIVLTTTGIAFLMSVDDFHTTLERALPFLILPFFMWLAFRFELIVAVTGVLLISLLAMYATVRGHGPFLLEGHFDSTLLLQIFVCIMSVSTLVLSSTVKERMDAQASLQSFNETLEARVQERTKALNDEIVVRKQAEARLQKTNQELSKRNMELDNFVYSVSHDLRAPIASVLGLINLARHDSDPAMKDTYLEMINSSALRQDHFIREILDQSRNSRLEVRREEVMFEPIIEETFNQLSFATPTGKAVEKIIRVNQQRPFYCDRWRLKVILNNIISNAIRYRNGRDPLIKVDVEVNGEAAYLSIRDNGKGIAPEHLKKVCQMFYRATDDGAGSGLGLYIVKEAVDKLNGSLDIDSTVGEGTTVRLVIPEVSTAASLPS